MPDTRSRIADNLAEVRQRMADAARRSGRDPAEATLVAVTKYVTAETARWLPELGCLTLGESRPQELWQKAEAMPDLGVEWHLIGHLQRNKIRRTLPLLTLLQSVDSLRLLDALQQEAERADASVEVLLEINISGDAEKTGFTVDAAMQLSEQLERWTCLNVCGLMAMSARLGDAEAARGDFARLRALRDRIQSQCSERVTLAHLSMGMSRDYEVAVEEGATLVRVGSALFEGVEA